MTVVPSGKVTLAIENEVASLEWDDVEDPALAAADPRPECVVVWPLTVVDDETVPPPAVTELDVVRPP